ncbi:hypothetical protein ABT294_01570 [Nonomuraea sp. NPDC000554]|uniref:hypothetical protein n=1 Tax=Nonomuraea sp. NPDC000554 TaxID=3154259 RepID=UPI0033341895
MLAFCLGLAWLLLAPLALWVLVRGRNPARVGAVLTFGLLEAATMALQPTGSAEPAPEIVAHGLPATPQCEVRTPVPESARLDGPRDGLLLSWPAASDECATAKVVLRQDGRRLRVWVHEGPLKGEHTGVRTVPVSVAGGAASLVVPVKLAGKGRYVAIDGRSGDRIPAEPAHAQPSTTP